MRVTTIVAYGAAALVLAVGVRATAVSAPRVAVAELKLVGESAMAENEAARLILAGGSCVVSGNVPNAVVSGNTPNAVVSGNVPDAVISGNTPTSKPPIENSPLRWTTARAAVPSPQIGL